MFFKVSHQQCKTRHCLKAVAAVTADYYLMAGSRNCGAAPRSWNSSVFLKGRKREEVNILGENKKFKPLSL